MPTVPTPRFEPTLGQLAPALSWLAHRGVNHGRLAVAFRTNRNYVRLLVHRGRADDGTIPAVGAHAADREKVHRALPPMEDATVMSAEQRARLEQFEQDIIDARRQAETSGDLIGGAVALSRLRPRLGRPASLRLLRLRALLNQHTAWCLTHSGLERSALRAARRSIDDTLHCFRETQDPGYLECLIATALIASHAELLRQRPLRAEKHLAVARHAVARLRRPLPSDAFRQVGVQAFQSGDDDHSRAMFEISSERMAGEEPFRSDLELVFNSRRHTLSFGIDWDRVRELLARVATAFRPDSLQQSMMTHWAAAAAFMTDSPLVLQESQQLVEANRVRSARFGHQATLNRLLLATPALRLDPRLRREWLRRVMYTNAYRQR